ncbi:hypothetical protein ACJ41O_000132 [Fusarium nematophilum]
MDQSTRSNIRASSQDDLDAPQASIRMTDDEAAKPRIPFSTVPFPPDPDFVDRPDILKWMHEKVTRPGARIALVGFGGIGKSQLAIQYAHQVRQRSPNTWVFWVYASTRERFKEAYESIADRLELPGRNDPSINTLRLVNEWLRVEENGRWMMILDSADDADVLFSPTSEQLASFLPQSSNGSIIVTSRSMDVAESLVGASDSIHRVPAMTTEEACQLLRAKLKGGHRSEAAAGLVGAVDHLPLAITQAAALIDNWPERMSISIFLSRIQSSYEWKARLLNYQVVDSRRDPSASKSVAAISKNTLEQVRRNQPSAVNLLSFMSCFDSRGIPKSILEADAHHRHGKDYEKILDKNLDVLGRYSLVTATPEPDVFDLNAFIHFYMHVWMQETGRTKRWKR